VENGAINPPPLSQSVSGRDLCDFSSTVLQNETVVVGLPVAYVCIVFKTKRYCQWVSCDISIVTVHRVLLCSPQRIPRNKLNSARSPCEEASHVHKHMIKGWTTDPHANEAYRPSSRTSYSAKQRQVHPEYHSDSRDDNGEQESTDNETEEYRLRLIILPGEKEEWNRGRLCGRLVTSVFHFQTNVP